MAAQAQFKLVLLGQEGVGKSSLVLRFVRDEFHEYQEATIGAAFCTKTMTVDGQTIKFEIWDTAGQERYLSLAPMYFRGAHAAIVVYDITQADSFEKAKKWVRDLRRQASPNTVIVLVGNKCDRESERVVSTDAARQYAADEEPLHFIEASAKADLNVAAIFETIAATLPAAGTQPSKPEGLDLHSGATGQGAGAKKSSCCVIM